MLLHILLCSNFSGTVTNEPIFRMLKGVYLPMEQILMISINSKITPQLIGGFLLLWMIESKAVSFSKTCFRFWALVKTWYLHIWNLVDQGHVAVLCFIWLFPLEAWNKYAFSLLNNRCLYLIVPHHNCSGQTQCIAELLSLPRVCS